MGNTHSSHEDPRGSSRKLSKPRVGNRDRLSAPPPASSNHGRVGPAQFSNSYLVGPVPVPSAAERQSIDIVPSSCPPPGTAVFLDKPPSSPIIDRTELPQHPPQSPVHFAHGDLLRAERIERRKSAGQSSTHSDANSQKARNRQNRASTQSLTRAQSVQDAEQRASTGYGVSLPEQALPRSYSHSDNRNSLVRRSNSHIEVQDAVCNMRKNSTSPQPEFPPPSRTQSETSLYAPARRRSMVLTPGVATRAEQQPKPKQKLRKKASFRRSTEPGPSAESSRQNSIDSSIDAKIRRHMSLPVPPKASQPSERASTPTDFDYQQIGGMKFGSLVITNGAPVPSPAKEVEDILSSPGASLPVRSLPKALAELPSQKPGLQVDTSAKGQQNIPVFSLQSPGSTSPVSEVTICHSPESIKASSRPESPELQTTSKHAAVDDDLFEEDEDDSPRPRPSSPISPTVQIVEVAAVLDVGIKSPTRPSLVHVTRRDSGFTSQNSQNSRTTMGTVDSGYGSNNSSTSVQRATQKRHTVGSAGDYLTAGRSTVSPETTPSTHDASNDPSPLRYDDSQATPAESLQPSISSKDDESVSTPRTSTSSNSRNMMRLPSLRGRKSKDTQDSKTEQPIKRSKSSTSTKMGGLRRLLSKGSRKKVASGEATQDVADIVPPIPSDGQSKIHEHSEQQAITPRRETFLRVEPSKASLATIMSVSDEANSPEQPHPMPRLPQVEPQPIAEPTTPSRRRAGRLSVSSVVSDAASSVFSPKSFSQRSLTRQKSDGRGRLSRSNSRKQMSVDVDSDDDVIVDSSIVDTENFSLPLNRRAAGHRSYDQGLATLSYESGRYPTAEDPAWLQAPYAGNKTQRKSQSHGQLRSRKSAPDVRQTIAGHLSPVFEKDHTKVSRTPPPISMQTRGSKKKRSSSKMSRRQTSPAGHGRPSAHFDLYDSGSNNSSHEDLQNYPSAARNGPYPAMPAPRSGPYPTSNSSSPTGPKMRRPLFGQRYSFDGHSSQPTQPPPRPQFNLAPMPSRVQSKDHWLPNRQGTPSNAEHQLQQPSNHARTQSSSSSSEAAGNAPFRVLHSYNSPAYKGIPIWG